MSATATSRKRFRIELLGNANTKDTLNQINKILQMEKTSESNFDPSEPASASELTNAESSSDSNIIDVFETAHIPRTLPNDNIPPTALSNNIPLPDNIPNNDRDCNISEIETLLDNNVILINNISQNLQQGKLEDNGKLMYQFKKNAEKAKSFLDSHLCSNQTDNTNNKNNNKMINLSLPPLELNINTCFIDTNNTDTIIH